MTQFYMFLIRPRPKSALPMIEEVRGIQSAKTILPINSYQRMEKFIMHKSLVFLLFAMTVCFQCQVSAQITDVTSVQSPPIPGAGHGYVQM